MSSFVVQGKRIESAPHHLLQGPKPRITGGAWGNYMKFYLLLLISCAAIGCASTSDRFKQEPGAVSVMAYNLENLFDTKHDKGTEDYTYLPFDLKDNYRHKLKCRDVRSRKYRTQCLELDWNEEVLQRKMERLADAILQVNDGKGPDILIVEEVENMNVLSRLNDEHLKPAQYQTVVLIEGFDKRGIDVAVLSRLKQIGKAKLHKIPYKGRDLEDQKWMNRSRGILQVDIELPDGSPLAVYAVHFPSPRNPTYWRQQAIVFLNKLMKKLPEGYLAIAGGDFNISGDEEKSDKLYANDLAKEWLVSHRIGCLDCRGTNYYHTKRQWSFLDALLFHKEMDKQKGQSNWYVEAKSIGIPNNSPYQYNRYMSPARFEPEGAGGVSDHWPIFGIIKPRRQMLGVK